VINISEYDIVGGGMTRLIKYMSEDLSIAFQSIKNDCKPFLQEIKGAGFIYRGIKNTSWFIKKTTRSNRNPMNMTQRNLELYDKVFKEKFGWKPRSEGVFTSADLDDMHMYGSIYYFFPIGI